MSAKSRLLHLLGRERLGGDARLGIDQAPRGRGRRRCCCSSARAAVWAWPQASVSELFARPQPPGGCVVRGYFVAGLTAMVGFWATLSLNIPTSAASRNRRRARSWARSSGCRDDGAVRRPRRGHDRGSAQIVGETVSDPITLIGRIDSPFWVVPR